MFIEYQEGRETMLILYKFSLFNMPFVFALSDSLMVSMLQYASHLI